MSFDELLVVIQLPSQSKSTAKAIVASAALHLDDISSNLLTTAIIALLTCSHEWTQIAAAKFLADSIQTGDTWRLLLRHLYQQPRASWKFLRIPVARNPLEI